MGKRGILLWLGAAGVATTALAQLLPAESPVSAPVRRSPSQLAADPASERFGSLPAREPIGKARGELFGPRSWEPAAPRVARRPDVQAPETPTAPPIPYRVAGQVVSENGMRVVLAKGDRVFEVRQGETLQDGYRVESIAPNAVTLVYTPLGLKQELAVTGTGLAVAAGQNVAGVRPPALQASPQQTPAQAQPTQATAPRTAQLRFEGPQQVRTGTPFDVALKLTSPQPVRAMPMQLSYDAKRLEPLAVRAGELFAGGNFTYRVNPSGSIFVGASGSGRAAADTDSLIVTFRPIASGPAELRVSSLLLQGAAGGTIAHEPPQIFRAAIVQ